MLSCMKSKLSYSPPLEAWLLAEEVTPFQPPEKPAYSGPTKGLQPALSSAPSIEALAPCGTARKFMGSTCVSLTRCPSVILVPSCYHPAPVVALMVLGSYICQKTPAVPSGGPVDREIASQGMAERSAQKAS